MEDPWDEGYTEDDDEEQEEEGKYILYPISLFSQHSSVFPFFSLSFFLSSLLSKISVS